MGAMERCLYTFFYMDVGNKWAQNNKDYACDKNKKCCCYNHKKQGETHQKDQIEEKCCDRKDCIDLFSQCLQCFSGNEERSQ